MRADALSDDVEAGLPELLRRRDELKTLMLQYDPAKSMEDLRYSCLETELAEVERKIAAVNAAALKSFDGQRLSDEEDLLRQERIG